MDRSGVDTFKNPAGDSVEQKRKEKVSSIENWRQSCARSNVLFKIIIFLDNAFNWILIAFIYCIGRYIKNFKNLYHLIFEGEKKRKENTILFIIFIELIFVCDFCDFTEYIQKCF